ncbi:hypothetical protein HOY34_09720 [Xinfangfangia sp. D13-10-4-6]|uniref:hypothetical protein n=1 Tax=Pseudogemmobacter hezensis TaxID=2737662 RepID=UPI00155558F6|nr:hypothetical protein [Pseudogemmobacter hezensis]NPD15476.1 hypothetical protein [Pseudogemmobacter hezensis]
MIRFSHSPARISALSLALCLCAGPAPAQAEGTGTGADDAAIALFSASFSESCAGAFEEDGSLVEAPQRHEVLAPSSWGEPEPVTVWQFSCALYAYNTAQVFMIMDEGGGVQPVALACPTLQIEYDEEAAAPGEADSVVSVLKINGWSADLLAINAEFDPATLTIRAHTYWRGLGDASDSSLWSLQDRAFRLQHFEADASYDGEINPVTLVDFR